MKESVVYQDIIQRGIQQGLQQGERNMVVRLLERRLGNLNKPIMKKIERLSLKQIEDLGEALLDFKSHNDLKTWLDREQTGNA